MKRYLLLALIVALVPPQVPCAVGVKAALVKKHLPLDVVQNVVMKTPETSTYLPDRVIVKVAAPGQSSGVFGVASLDRYLQQFGVYSITPLFPAASPPSRSGEVDLTQIYVLRYSSPVDPFAVARELSQLQEVVYAEPWFIYPVNGAVTCTPNDTSRGKQWALDRIQADSAWCVSQGDTSVVIGIIDTGVQLDHPDLQPNIWLNPGEMGLDSAGHDKRFNGIDDDHDGKVDDWRGWDFGGADYANPVEDNDPSPVNVSSGHGTHVAGIAGAATNNVTGVAGMGYRCRLLAVKTSSDNDTRGGGFPYIVFGFEGIQYAADMGAKVINCSWGGEGASQFEQDVIDYATAKGALVVAAAGNAGTSAPGYPASYNHVLSVAATDRFDTKASYSSYGPTVDVSAPGGTAFNQVTTDIYSTDYQSTYGVAAGTSESAPFAAGLAALVRTVFPSYSGLQAGEQVRATADNIDGLNPSYVGQLGKGRINALRALTTSTPSLRMTAMSVKDSAGGNNNGVLEPNETFTVVVTITNYLQPTSPAATVSLVSADTSVQVVSGSYPIGTVATMDSVSNAASPFQVHVKSTAAQGHLAFFTLMMSDGSYSDYQVFSLLINPTFASHNINKVDVTLTSNGKVAFNDFPTNTEGDGFVYPYPGGGNQLFEGGLIVGTSATRLVDIVRNVDGVQDADFISSGIYDIRTPGAISDQDGHATFTDAGAPSGNQIGLSVAMSSYAFKSPPDSNYVILRYNIRNASGGALSNLFAGLFLDWDVLPNYATNKTAFDSSRSLGYAWDTAAMNGVYCGVRALDGAAGFRGLINSPSIDLSRAAKWSWLSGGFVPSNIVGDVHMAISEGPFTLAAGDSQSVGFALLGGTDLPALQSSADAAWTKWNDIRAILGVEETPNSLPAKYALAQNYPNPFNPVTRIRYALPSAAHVVLKIYNLLGQEVSTLVDEMQQPGWYTQTWDAGNAASGVYFYRLTAGTFSSVRKLVVLR